MKQKNLQTTKKTAINNKLSNDVIAQSSSKPKQSIPQIPFYKKKGGAVWLSIIVSLCLVVGFLLVAYFDKIHGLYDGDGYDFDFDQTIEYNGENYKRKDSLQTILVVGLDKFDTQLPSEENFYNNDQQADFIILFLLDNRTQSATAIHINRDTMVNVPILGVTGQKIGEKTQQIALSHNYGNGEKDSCRNVATSVSNLLYGMRVDHYLSLTMDAVQVLNDAVGGVPVTVLDDFSGIDDTLVQGKEITLWGEQALKYVRSRQGLEDSSNEHRMIRRRQYMQSLMQQSKSCFDQDENFMLETAETLSSSIVSNCGLTQLIDFYKKFVNYTFDGIRTIEGTSKQGERFMEFTPNPSALKQLIVDLFYKKEE